MVLTMALSDLLSLYLERCRTVGGVNKRDNPYTPGAGRKPRTLAGRDQELETFQSLVERLDAGAYERSLIYTGLRGVGKTVLLMEFDVLASEAGWATTDVQEVGSEPRLPDHLRPHGGPPAHEHEPAAPGQAAHRACPRGGQGLQHRHPRGGRAPARRRGRDGRRRLG